MACVSGPSVGLDAPDPVDAAAEAAAGCTAGAAAAVCGAVVLAVAAWGAAAGGLAGAATPDPGAAATAPAAPVLLATALVLDTDRAPTRLNTCGSEGRVYTLTLAGAAAAASRPGAQQPVGCRQVTHRNPDDTAACVAMLPCNKQCHMQVRVMHRLGAMRGKAGSHVRDGVVDPFGDRPEVQDRVCLGVEYKEHLAGLHAEGLGDGALLRARPRLRRRHARNDGLHAANMHAGMWCRACDIVCMPCCGVRSA